MPDSTAQVRQDLVTYFGAGIAAAAHFQDYATIGSYLSDVNQFGPVLLQLEQALQEEFDRRFDALGVDYMREYGQPNTDKTRRWYREWLIIAYERSAGGAAKPGDTLTDRARGLFRKLLTGALARNEARHRFSIAEDNPKPDILVGTPGREFNDFLRAGKPFKDINAGPEHGENSHRIQWYLVSNCPTLTHAPVDIYKGLPKWRTESAKLSPTSPRKFYLWEFLFDRDGVPSNAALIPFRTGAQSDFRAPSNVNRALAMGEYTETVTTIPLDGGGKAVPRSMDLVKRSLPFSCPMLRLCLSDRFAKRSREPLDHYILRKQGLNEEQIQQRLHQLGMNPGLIAPFFEENMIIRR
jgi:hypothetical protein